MSQFIQICEQLSSKLTKVQSISKNNSELVLQCRTKLQEFKNINRQRLCKINRKIMNMEEKLDKYADKLKKQEQSLNKLCHEEEQSWEEIMYSQREKYQQRLMQAKEEFKIKEVQVQFQKSQNNKNTQKIINNLETKILNKTKILQNKLQCYANTTHSHMQSLSSSMQVFKGECKQIKVDRLKTKVENALISIESSNTLEINVQAQKFRNKDAKTKKTMQLIMQLI